MKRIIFPMFYLSAALLFACTNCTQTAETAKENKAIFIIVDGISADILESVDTPNIDRIIEQGAYSRGWLGGKAGRYSQSPTVSAVGYNHVITGVWSNKHNVYDNDIESPNYNYWNIFRLFKHNYPEKPVAIYSSWLDNRTKLAGDGLPEAGGITIDIHYDGFDVDTLAFPHDYGYVQKIDDHVSNMAAQSISADAPYLSWVYLWYPDDTGHRYGEVEEHFESIKVADEQVGRIWDAVQYRMENYNEDWLLLITTDHGRRLPDGSGHGGQSERERTIWLVSSNADMNRFFQGGHPPVTSVYQTVSRFLGLEVPPSLKKELDGIPLIGDVSISDADAYFNEDEQVIDLTWTAWENDGNVRIHIAITNEFRSGGEDAYELVAEVPLTDGRASIDVSNMQSDFYKIAIEARHNTVNSWVIIKNE
ncbi:MAG: alkaline phosphatase family protein [Balneolaceae bacterium]|nr:MAG: alkaline phosphatase family protein [Balneolaceae bacterium]